MSKGLDKIKERMDSPEGKAALEKVMQKFEDKRLANVAYFETDEFKKALTLIHTDIEMRYAINGKGAHLDEESYRYFPDDFKTPYDDLIKVFSAIDESDLEEIEISVSIFGGYIKKYDGLVFEWICGQGTSLMIYKEEDYKINGEWHNDTM